MRMRRHLPEDELEFQIAPMVDVLLCLLVFFIMTTSAGVLRADRNLTLPVAPNSTRKDAARYEAILNVRWAETARKGSVQMENVVYDDLAKITPILAPRVKAMAAYRAVIRADRDCPARYVGKVMAACAEAGIDDNTFSVLNRE
jgi:biopolymer transport protein ExbD